MEGALLGVGAIDGGVEEGADYTLTCAEFEQLLDHIGALEEALDLASVDWCRICGHTADTCGDDAWMETDTLCSSCRYQVEEADDDEGWQVRDLLTGEVLGDQEGSIIFTDRETAELSAAMGVSLFQLSACQACAWRGRYPEETGTCPECGGEVHGLDEGRRVDGRPVTGGAHA